MSNFNLDELKQYLFIIIIRKQICSTLILLCFHELQESIFSNILATALLYRIPERKRGGMAWKYKSTWRRLIQRIILSRRINI